MLPSISDRAPRKDIWLSDGWTEDPHPVGGAAAGKWLIMTLVATCSQPVGGGGKSAAPSSDRMELAPAFKRTSGVAVVGMGPSQSLEEGEWVTKRSKGGG